MIWQRHWVVEIAVFIDENYKDLSENEYGEVLKGTEYKPDNTMKSSFENNYDKDGHFIGGSGKDSTGKEIFHSTVKLNDKGDAAEETTMTVTKDSTKNETVTYKYDSYDDQGNWTQRTTYNDKGKPTKIVKRTYTYYKDWEYPKKITKPSIYWRLFFFTIKIYLPVLPLSTILQLQPLQFLLHLYRSCKIFFYLFHGLGNCLRPLVYYPAKNPAAHLV